MFELGRTTAPLQSIRDRITMIGGLDHGTNGGHFSIHTFLSGVRQIDARSMPDANVTIDQYAAESVAGQTRFPTLTIGSESGIHGGCQLSWTRTGTRVTPVPGPQQLFKLLFENSTEQEKASAADRFRLQGSILDMVRGDAKDFHRKLNAQDGRKLDEYLTSIRDVEKRLRLRSRWSDVPRPPAPIPEPKNRNMVEDLPLLYDLIALALETDSTRIATLEIGGDFNPRNLGVNGDYHALSHHGQLPDRIEALVTIETYQVQQFVRFIERLSARTESEQTLLDQTTVLFGSGMGNANSQYEYKPAGDTCRRRIPTWEIADVRPKVAAPAAVDQPVRVDATAVRHGNGQVRDQHRNPARPRMSRAAFQERSTAWLALVVVVLLAAPAAAQSRDAARLFLGKYCLDCHSKADPSGEREFESLDLAGDQPETQLRLQEIIDQLNLGAMPPAKEIQPASDERLAAVEQLTAILAGMRERSTSTSRQTVLRRLSRREYRNTVRDLLGIDVTMFDPTVEFPADNLSHNFDNVGDALTTSGQLLEKYLEAADQCVEKAFEHLTPVDVQEWTFRDGFVQQQELERAHRLAFDSRYLVLYDHPLNDKPEGAYGHLARFRSGVPADGEYEIQVLAEALHRDTVYGPNTVFINRDEPFRMGIRPGNPSIGDMAHTQPIEPRLAEVNVADNELKWYSFRLPLDRGFAPRFTFENGQQDVRGSYQRVFRNHRETLPEHARNGQGIVEHRNAVIRYGELPQIRIHEVRIRGPLDSPAASKTKQILLGDADFDESRVPELIARFASRAYRRPPTPEEVAGLIAIYRRRLADGHSAFKAYKDTLKASLCSPGFLYFSRPQDADADRLSTHGLAERLSYFLTSSMPDEQLRGLADSGRLSDPEVLRAEARGCSAVGRPMRSWPTSSRAG